jgi:hypothetical protein
VHALPSVIVHGEVGAGGPRREPQAGECQADGLRRDAGPEGVVELGVSEAEEQRSGSSRSPGERTGDGKRDQGAVGDRGEGEIGSGFLAEFGASSLSFRARSSPSLRSRSAAAVAAP